LAEGREASRAAPGELELEAAEQGLLGIRWLNRDLGWLFVLRILRSIPQGYLGIILPLYLALLGYSAVALGTLLAFSAIAAALISMLTGVLSDRFGRKALIAIISLLFAVGGVGFAFARSFFWIVTFAAIGSIGRGGALAGGAWGLFIRRCRRWWLRSRATTTGPRSLGSSPSSESWRVRSVPSNGGTSHTDPACGGAFGTGNLPRVVYSVGLSRGRDGVCDNAGTRASTGWPRRPSMRRGASPRSCPRVR
jgi:MFS family permease